MALSTSSASTVLGGRYQLGEPLGRGGMAEVRAGTDLRLGRPVAVKVLLPEMAARDDIRRRFQAEACSAAQLCHPHAVAVYDTGEHEGVPYIVMERLPGDTLADRIAAGPADPEWVRTIAGQVLGALGAAHAAGLVHRDVKPGNILLTSGGDAKIADFGIAKSLEGAGDGVDLTGTGQLLGTPAYLPPERLDGAPATARSDLYSLGVVLYEAISGFRPFDGHTPVAAAMAVAAGVHRPLSEVCPGTDPALAAAVERAMAPDPEQRFASAAEMAAALGGVTAADTPTLDNIRATSIMEGPLLASAPPSRRRPRRTAVRLALVALVVLVLAAVALAGRDRRHGPATTSNSPAPTTTAAVRVSSGSEAPATTAAPTVTAPSPPVAQATVAPPRATTPATAAGNGNGDGKGKGNGKGKEKGND